MKTYLAIFLGSADEMAKWMAQSETERKAREKTGIEGWKNWATKNEKSIVNLGGPLGKTLKIDKKGITPTRNELGAWTLVRAESQEAAAKLFVEHPHFTIFPGHSVEVMECLAIPGM